MVLTVKYKDGEEAKEFELSVGDEDENGNYYARLNELPVDSYDSWRVSDRPSEIQCGFLLESDIQLCFDWGS